MFTITSQERVNFWKTEVVWAITAHTVRKMNACERVQDI